MKTFLSLSSAAAYLVATVLNVSCSGGPQGIEGMTVEYAENKRRVLSLGGEWIMRKGKEELCSVLTRLK